MTTDLTVPELISPEGLQVAQAYLTSDGDIYATARELDLPIEIIQQYLEKREVRAFVDRVYEESGFRNKHKIGRAMDAIIAQKLEEMDETELGSGKDIAELLEMQHKMTMAHMAMKIKLIEAENKREQQMVASQTNIQVNALVGGKGYNELLDKLLG